MINLNDPSTLTIISWIIFGLIVGIVVHALDPKDVRGGLLGTLLTGIVGALLGGFLANLFFGIQITGFNATSFLIAIAGGLILAIIQRFLFREREHIKTETKRLQ